MRIPSRFPGALKGPGQIAIGLGFGGLGTLIMVTLASRGLAAEQFSVFLTWWLTATLLVTVFGVFEVYLARAWMSASAAGRPTRPVVAQVGGLCLVLAMLLLAVLVLAAVPLGSAAFGGRAWAAPAIGVFGLVGCVQAILRGTATAQRRFGIVGLQLGVDGAARAVLVGLCAWLSPGSLELMVAVVIFAGLLSVLVAGWSLVGWVAVPHPLSGTVPVSPIGWLLAGSLGPILINNLVMPWYAAADSGRPELVAGFGAAMTLARLPTQFVSAAFGPMMAELSASLDRGDEQRHHRVLHRALRAAALLGLAFVVGFVALGPWALGIYVGPAYVISSVVLGLLAASSSGLFFATIQQSSLAARQRWGTIAIAWVAAALVFGLVLLLPLPPLARAALAPVVSVAGASVALAIGMRRATALAQSPATSGASPGR